MKYLSEEKIELKIYDCGQKYKAVNAKDYGVDWNLSYFKGIETSIGARCHRIFLKNNQMIPVGKNGKCEIRRVEKGLLEGCLVLAINEGGASQEDAVYLVGDNGAVKMPIEHATDVEKIDQYLDREVFVRMVAKQLNTCTIRKGAVQGYEIMFSRLPSKCWKDEKFSENVIGEFYKSGFMNIEDDVDYKYVNFEECKRQAGWFFHNFMKEKSKEEERVK